MALGRTCLTASCQAVAEAPGTARRWRLQAQQQTGLGAWPQGSRSPRSWWLQQARRHMGTGRKWLEGTERRLGWLVYTQGRARTVMGQGWQGSPRWAAQWLVGRCSGESACGPSRVSVAVGRVGKARSAESRSVPCPAQACIPIYKTDAATHQVCTNPRAFAQAMPSIHRPLSARSPSTLLLRPDSHSPIYPIGPTVPRITHGLCLNRETEARVALRAPGLCKHLGNGTAHMLGTYLPLQRHPYSLATHYLPDRQQEDRHTHCRQGHRAAGVLAGCWAIGSSRGLTPALPASPF